MTRRGDCYPDNLMEQLLLRVQNVNLFFAAPA